jgi:hypothetical protein
MCQVLTNPTGPHLDHELEVGELPSLFLLAEEDMNPENSEAHEVIGLGVSPWGTAPAP